MPQVLLHVAAPQAELPRERGRGPRLGQGFT